MAISYVGIASAQTTSATLPSFQVGDVAIILTFNNAAATAPTRPSGWSPVNATWPSGTNSTEARGWNAGYRVLQAGDTSTGTWTNATDIVVAVYRGVDKNSPIDINPSLEEYIWNLQVNIGSAGVPYATGPIIGYGTNILYVNLSANSSDTSLAAHSAGGSWTNRSSGTTNGRVGVWDTTSSWAQGSPWTASGSPDIIYLKIALRPENQTTYPMISDTDTTSGTVTSNSSSWTLTYPTNIAAGDLLIGLVGRDGSGAGATWPADWVGTVQNGAGAVTFEFAKKKATGSESGNFTLTLSGSEQGSWVVYRIPAGTWYGTLGTTFNVEGASGSAEASSNYSAAGASQYPDPPSLNPNNWDAENTLWIAAMSADTSRTVSAYPSSPDTFTNTGSLVSGGSNGATLAWGRLEKNASSVDPGTFTISNSDDWASLTIAIRPRQYFSVVAQAQAQIGGIAYRGYGQAQAQVKAFNVRNYAQSQASIISTLKTYGQSQAQVKVTFPRQLTIIQDSFTDGDIDLVNHSPNIGGAWIEKWKTGGTRGAISSNQLYWAAGSTNNNVDYYNAFPLKSGYIQFNGQATSIGAAISVLRVRQNATLSEQTSYYIVNNLDTSTITLYRLVNGGSITALGNAASNGSWSRFFFAESNPTSLKVETATNVGSLGTGWQIDLTDNNAANQIESGLVGIGGSYNRDANDDFLAMLIDGSTFGQALAQIKATYQGFAQALGHIKVFDSNIYAQAQSHIKQMYQGYGQSLSQIRATYAWYGQAMTSIKSIYQAYGQSLSHIKSTLYGYGQSQATIKAIAIKGFGQASVWIKATYPRSGGDTVIAQDSFTESGTGTAALSTHTPEIGGSWTESWVSGTGTGYLIDKDNDRTAFTWDSEVFQQTYRLSPTLDNGYVQEWVSGSYAHLMVRQVTDNLDTFYRAISTGPVTATEYIIRVTNGVATTIGSAVVTSGNWFRFQATGSSPTYLKYEKRSTQGELGTGWQIEISDNTAANQTPSGYIGLFGYGDNDFGTTAIDDYLGVQLGSGIEGPTFAQANAQIKQTYLIYGQSQAHIKSIGYNYGQSQAQISAQITSYDGYGQALATIQAIYQVFGQSQSQIKQTYRGFGQSASWIRATYPREVLVAKDSFTETLDTILTSHTAEIGGTWSFTWSNSPGSTQWSVGGQSNTGTAFLSNTVLPNVWLAAAIEELSDGYIQANVSAINKVAERSFVFGRQIIGDTDCLYVFGGGYDSYVQGMTIWRVTSGVWTGLGSTSITSGKNWARLQITGNTPTSLKAEHRATEEELGTGWDIQTTDNTALNQSASGYTGIIGYSYDDGDSQETTDNIDNFSAGYIENPTFANAQAKIKQTYQRFAQTQAQVKQTYQSYGQAQSQISAQAVSYSVYGQSQAQIKSTSYNFANVQGYILGSYLGYGNTQAQIKATYQSYGQAQAHIKQVYRGYAQSQAQVKQTYQGFSQAQSQIKQTYRGYAQAQVQVRQTYRGYAQAQAQIKQTYQGYAQAQTQIRQIYRGYGQAQGQLKQTYYGFAQAMGQIKQTYLGYAQAQATILVTSKGYAQAQSDILQTYQYYGQALGYISVTELEGFGQALATIAAGSYVYAQANAWIYLPQIARPSSDTYNADGWVGTVNNL